jgi:type I restriction enzyme R subunit
MFKEENLENMFMKLFEERGYEHILGTTIERDPRQILLTSDFQTYLKNRYPDLDQGELYYIQATFATLDQGDYVNNRQTFRKICNGIDMKRMQEGKKPLHIDFIDFQHPENNIFKIINQYSIQGPKETRRPDALVFVNGIPLVIIEFKSATNEDATLYNAYEQICERYVRDISDLFAYNAFCVISDGVNSRIGTHFSNYENFYSWNKANSKDAASEGIDNIEILMDGVFEKKRFLSIIKDFIYFPDDSGNNLKIVCRYPQYFGANALYENIRKHMKPEGDGKGGTYFGTTGCGKSYTMLFLSRLLMTSKEMKNPTIVVITDRNNLDIQLHSQFVKSKRFLMDDNIVSISSREDLKNKLSGCRSGGVYLTTIQKFSDGDEALSDRNNIIVISDEAHRSQLNLEDADKMVNGVRTHVTPFALMLHKALPNATYVGFTGTPIDNTLEVFGGIVDQYTMVESEKDKITSKLVYEGRAAKVVLDQSQMDAIEQYYADCEDMGANQYQIEKSKKDLAKMENIIGNETRLQKIAKDFVAHYEKRVYEGATVAGKALFVCSNRKIAYNFYLELKRIRPEWFTVKEADNTGLPDSDKAELIEMVKIVATRGMNDPKEMYDLLGDEQYRENLAVQFKKINSNFKIAIVVDMWLTGFDVPFLDAIYIDKPIQKHNLIQAISRVNRIYPGKEYGLIVDYLGIRKELDAALKKYTNGYRSEGLETSEEFLSVMREYLSIIDGIFFGFDMSDYNSDEEATVLKCLNRAVEFVQKDRDTEKRFMCSVVILFV